MEEFLYHFLGNCSPECTTVHPNAFHLIFGVLVLFLIYRSIQGLKTSRKNK